MTPESLAERLIARAASRRVFEDAIDFTRVDLPGLYSKFNREYFGSDLPTSLSLRMAPLKSASGVTNGKILGATPLHRRGLLPIFGVTNLSITISSLVRYDESELDGVLLHEMVHVWLMVSGYPFESHGEKFRSKASEISGKSGIKIPLTHTYSGPVVVNGKARDLGLLTVGPSEHAPERFVLFQRSALTAYLQRAEKFISMIRPKHFYLFNVTTDAWAHVPVKRAPDSYGLTLFQWAPVIAQSIDLSKAQLIWSSAP